jgi:hypothetical protein
MVHLSLREARAHDSEANRPGSERGLVTTNIFTGSKLNAGNILAIAVAAPQHQVVATILNLRGVPRWETLNDMRGSFKFEYMFLIFVTLIRLSYFGSIAFVYVEFSATKSTAVVLKSCSSSDLNLRWMHERGTGTVPLASSPAVDAPGTPTLRDITACAGTANPCACASRCHRYNVAFDIPVRIATSASDSFSGADINNCTHCLFS